MLIYRPAYSDNFFRKAHIIALGYTVFGIAVATALSLTMRRKNQLPARYRAEQAQSDEKASTDRAWSHGDVADCSGLVVAKTLGDRATGYTFQI